MTFPSPVGTTRARAGLRYRVGAVEHVLPALDYGARPPFLLREAVLRDMARLLEITHALLSAHGITYWISCGTLLGAHRHGGITPWDDDLDVNVLFRELPRLLSLEGELVRRGLALTRAGGGYKLAYRNLPRFPFVDLVVVHERAGTLDLCFPLDARGAPTFAKAAQWPGECFPANDVFPLLDVPFEHFVVRAPQQGKGLIERMYGPHAFTRVGGVKRVPWLDNHYYDALLFRLGLIPG